MRVQETRFSAPIIPISRGHDDVVDIKPLLVASIPLILQYESMLQVPEPFLAE